MRSGLLFAAQLGWFWIYQIVLRCTEFPWFGESVSTEASHSISSDHFDICVKYEVFFFWPVSVCFHLHPAENESRSHRFNTRYWSINCAHLGANMNQCYSVVTNKAQTGGKLITQAEKLNGKQHNGESGQKLEQECLFLGSKTCMLAI